MLTHPILDLTRSIPDSSELPGCAKRKTQYSPFLSLLKCLKCSGVVEKFEDASQYQYVSDLKTAIVDRLRDNFDDTLVRHL